MAKPVQALNGVSAITSCRLPRMHMFEGLLIVRVRLLKHLRRLLGACQYDECVFALQG